MDSSSKRESSIKSEEIGTRRLTPSELRVRLFQEQEGRIVELVKHNAELSKALEHEREQNQRLTALADSLASRLPLQSDSSRDHKSSGAKALLDNAVGGWISGLLTATTLLIASAFWIAVVSMFSHRTTPVHIFDLTLPPAFGPYIVTGASLLFLPILTVATRTFLRDRKKAEAAGFVQLRAYQFVVSSGILFVGIAGFGTAQTIHSHASYHAAMSANWLFVGVGAAGMAYNYLAYSVRRRRQEHA